METDLILVIVTGVLGLIGTLTFTVSLGLRMSKQLEPDAHLKTVKTVLIEGEVLDVVINTDALEYLPDRIT